MYIKEKQHINELVLPNRLIMPPMHTGKTVNGQVTAELCEYYRQRAGKGAIGLIITEFAYISSQGKATPTQLSISDDGDIEMLSALVKAIQEEGSKTFAQMNHAGIATISKITGEEVVGPSAVYNPKRKNEVLPRALEKEEILAIEEQFVSAAMRAKAAGYDGVEIHSAHGYLLNQFYSPLTNKRTDEYGADTLENRTRFHVEVIQKVRHAVGNSYPVAIRFGGCDYMDGGSTPEDCVAACQLFEKAGIDMIDLSGGMCGFQRPGHSEPGYFKDMSSAVKQKTTVPILLTGGITTAEQAEELLSNQMADLIGIGRALLTDEAWFEKNRL